MVSLSAKRFCGSALHAAAEAGHEEVREGGREEGQGLAEGQGAPVDHSATLCGEQLIDAIAAALNCYPAGA